MTALPAAIDTVVVVDDVRLFTRRRPGTTHPPLVMIQGIGGSLESWQPLLDAMPDRDVVMVDTPGAGRSQRPPRPIRMPAICDHVVAATRRLGIEHADVLGYSLGGMVAQEIAHRHPDFTRKLTLVDTSFGVGAMPGHPKLYRVLLSTKRYRDRNAAEYAIPLLGGGRTARDPDVLAAMLDVREGHAPTRMGYYFQHYAVLGWSSYCWLPTLRMPALILHGDADPIVPVSNGRRLAARIPNAQLSIVPGAGHLLPFDEPEKAAPILERFLDD